jgi:uncharacterized protein (TIGR02001 family)
MGNVSEPATVLARAGTVLCLVLVGLPCAIASDAWQLSAAATSDNVHRGISHNDAQPALQAGISYRLPSGIHASLWGSTVSNGRTTVQEAAGHYELAYSAGYSFAPGERWEVDVSWLRYTYPESRSGIDYDYQEWVLSFGIDGWLWLTAAVSPDTTLYTRRGLDQGITAYAWELAGQRALGPRLSTFAGIGYQDLSAGRAGSYTYFNLGLSGRLRAVDLQVQYVATRHAKRSYGSRLAGPRFVLGVMVGLR